MAMKKIKVTIDQLGGSTVEAIGFNGVGCIAATSKIEAALGSEPAVRVEKPEIHNSTGEAEQEFMRY
jgi:hypothetical protein